MARKRSQARVSSVGPLHFRLRHRLAEGDGRRLDRAAAVRADRQGLVGQEGLADRLQVVIPAAVQAVRVGRVAVEFDHLRSAGTPDA